ncbi:MAG: carboxymuconolactone decarboxylase family protein [Dehalococcoidia bacterium]|nr:carboxymuconolactone decarboxylase family protein [Dehalococcoidia bacterium]
MTRVPLVSRDDFPEELRYVWDRLKADQTVGSDAVPNIFRTMGNNAPLLRNYLRLGNSLWKDIGIDTATRELVILRAAILEHSMYEWHQHVAIGRAAGLSDDRIRALHHWRTSDLFSESERALLAYVDALAATDHPLQEVHDGLAAHFPAATIVGVNLIIGFYIMTARFLGAMEVQPETAFVGWELRG